MIDNSLLNKIHHADCFEILAQIPDNSIDLIFADPPYFMQTDGILRRTDGTKFMGVDDICDKFKNYKEYDSFCLEWLTQCKRILKKDGCIWVIGSFQNIYRIGYIMQNLGFWILNDVIWSKPNATPNFGGTRFKNAHETLLWCSKDKKAKYKFNYKTMKFLNNNIQDKSIWDIGICIGKERIKTSDGKKAHSTQKPEQLLYKIIVSSTKPNDIILDPFFGSGTTGAIAKKLGRQWIGIEMDSNYIKIAKNRIDNVKYCDNDIGVSLSLEVLPPKVSTVLLIKHKLLHINESLYDKEHNKRGIITECGKVYDGHEVLSIHKMGAKFLNKPNLNGWGYFYVLRDKNLLSINNLRYEFNNCLFANAQC